MARVALRDIEKRFGSTRALRGASLEIEPGEIHALLGENGAGKSTLVRILYGELQPDAGEIRIDDAPVRLASPSHALARGIGLVHQHFMLVPALSVAENLVLGEPGGAWLTPAALRRRADEIAARWGLGLEPDARVETLAVGQMQRLEIVRALARGARTLVLDEPTAVLAPSEVDALLALLVRLREAGHGIVLISHKLAEITAVCDRVTVLRAGATVATRPVAGASADALGRLMVGEALPAPRGPIAAEPGPVALRLRGACAAGLGPIDLEVCAGEVVVLAGIDGNGQAPLEELLAGVRALESGSVEVCRPPLALVSGDRQRTGLALELSVAENLVLEEAGRGGGDVFRRGVLDRAARARAAREAIERFAVRAEADTPARALSGGNQQKLCIARALRRAPGVLVAVNPTRGLDVAATRAVRDEIRAQARAGTAVLVVSTELDEVSELANRIGVLFRGRLVALGAAETLGRERIGRQMLGEPG